MAFASVADRLPSRAGFLLLYATLLLAVALVLAWVLGVTLFFPKGELASQIVERADLIRAHIDYLMMAQFFLIFGLLARQFAIEPPRWAIAAASFGAFYNPLGFVRRAYAPKLDPAHLPEPHFPPLAALSFAGITIGFLVLALLAVRAAWRSARQKQAALASAE
ncbi:MAG TPA: hypothetical protein VEH76_02445 [Methylocystis sp.]|nr:hypothetical protein [Methylocystis sp.]